MRKNSKLNTNQIVTPMPTEPLFVHPKRWQVPIERAMVLEPLFGNELILVALPNPRNHQ